MVVLHCSHNHGIRVHFLRLFSPSCSVKQGLPLELTGILCSCSPSHVWQRAGGLQGAVQTQSPWVKGVEGSAVWLVGAVNVAPQGHPAPVRGGEPGVGGGGAHGDPPRDCLMDCVLSPETDGEAETEGGHREGAAVHSVSVRWGRRGGSSEAGKLHPPPRPAPRMRSPALQAPGSVGERPGGTR